LEDEDGKGCEESKIQYQGKAVDESEGMERLEGSRA
jgi:hypothetical protein